jgi:hypothetical protein
LSLERGTLPGTTTRHSKRGRLLAKWFLIGFVVRMTLAVFITLLMTKDLEAGMLYLADFPTIACLDLIERSSPSLANQLSGNHPYYVPLNLLGSFIWGLLFMLAAYLVRLIKARKHFS